MIKKLIHKCYKVNEAFVCLMLANSTAEPSYGRVLVTSQLLSNRVVYRNRDSYDMLARSHERSTVTPRRTNGGTDREGQRSLKQCLSD